MRSIVVFDGDCGLCNGFVAWLVRRDRHGRLLISGSAGEVGRLALESMGLDPRVAGSTLVLATPHGPQLRSAAVLGVMRELGWPWRMLTAGRLVPHPLRDRVYDAIAARRPRGVADDPACGMPPPALVDRWRSRLATADDVAALSGPDAPGS